MKTQNSPIQLNNSVENQIKLVDAPTLQEWIDRDTVLLVDVREPA